MPCTRATCQRLARFARRATLVGIAVCTPLIVALAMMHSPNADVSPSMHINTQPVADSNHRSDMHHADDNPGQSRATRGDEIALLDQH